MGGPSPDLSFSRTVPRRGSGPGSLVRRKTTAIMNRRLNFIAVSGLFLFSLMVPPVRAQQTVRFDQLPGHERYQELNRIQRQLAAGGRVSEVEWAKDGKSLRFELDGDAMQFFFESGERVPAGETEMVEREAPPERPRRSRVPRAEQRPIEISPDGKWQAVYRDFNVWIEPTEGNPGERVQVTEGGDERHRFGTCCWVYGEELNQSEAMWWSPNGRFLVFYEVDEQGMKDYYLTTGNTDLYTEVLAVRYPKAGDPNPVVNLHVHDRETGANRKLTIEGDPTQYLYDIRFTPAGDQLLVNRTNRHQNVLDVLAIDIQTGDVATVVTEQQETWQENSPLMRFLEDGQRFVWATERNGWRHFELRNLQGELLNPLSEVAEYPCEEVVEIDEEAGFFYYTAYSDENPYNAQLHRARLDGSEPTRITHSPLNHTSFEISPFHDYVVAVREQVNVPPATVVYSSDGREIGVLAEASTGPAEAEGVRMPELFSFVADDNRTEIYGTLHFPTNFDTSVEYPLLIDVYGGPESRGISNRYRPINPICELGFVVAKIGNRGTVGRGKAFESATYLNLGGPDLQDQADGVRYLGKRPYIDANRVGIFGHSYGGYMSALAVLRHPDVFQVAVAGAPVTDWKNYDTIYTERYMRTPQENPEGYRAGSCMEYVDQLKGQLLLVHGLIDDNVHPSNSWQLARKLQLADQRFEMMIYPGFKHGVGSTYGSLRWEFFCRHLQPQPASVEVAGAAGKAETPEQP